MVAVMKNDRKNGIAVHARDTGHTLPMGWEEATVKEVKPNLTKRPILEALHFQQRPHTTNLDCGIIIDLVCFSLLTQS